MLLAFVGGMWLMVVVGPARAAERFTNQRKNGMANFTEQDIGFQSVAFDDDGERIVGVLIGIRNDGEYVVGNPHYDYVWHVPPDEAAATDDPITAPAD
jgi:hypothetical protein